MKKLIFILICGAIIISSCNRRILDFTIISTKNVDLHEAASFERGNDRVEGVDQAHIIIFIPTGQPHMKEAVDRAIESIPGCIALLDGVVYSKYWWIPLIYGKTSFLVEGTPLIDPSQAFIPNDIHKYRKIEVDMNGDIEGIEIISSAEYLALKNKMIRDSKSIKFKKSLEIE